MQNKMAEFADKGGADAEKLTFYEDQYAHLQTAFSQMSDAETEGRRENDALKLGLETLQAQLKHG